MTLAEDALLTVVKVPEHPPSLTVIFGNPDNHSSHNVNNITDYVNNDRNTNEDLEDVDNNTSAAKDRFTIWCESGISFPATNLSIFWNNKRLMKNDVLSYREEEVTVTGSNYYFAIVLRLDS